MISLVEKKKDFLFEKNIVRYSYLWMILYFLVFKEGQGVLGRNLMNKLK